MELQTAADNPRIKLEDSWKKALSGEFEKPYMAELRKFLSSEIQKGKTIYPKPSEYFAAFQHTPISQVKVVILGQDPYHGPGQAHGLCFSVKPGVVPPPSLKNIFQELKSDTGCEIPNHGCLVDWTRQGVLLINSVLTVENGQAASHRDRGWEKFTDKVIEVLNRQERPIVFMLWGSYAQKKGQYIDRQKHLILESVHPSPLSAYRGFLGCRHFSKANEFLISRGIAPVDWEVSNEPDYKF